MLYMMIFQVQIKVSEAYYVPQADEAFLEVPDEQQSVPEEGNLDGM